MIGRFLRWLAADERGEVPVSVPPPALPETPDLAGVLVRCIADGWYNAPRGAPAKDQLCKVVSCQMKPLNTGNGVLLMLTLDGIPGEYAAMGFVQAEPDNEPATPDFADQMRSVRRRVRTWGTWES